MLHPIQGTRARLPRRLAAIVAVAAACAALPASATAFGPPFIGSFTKVTEIGSTVPSNGDLNPYGIVNVNQSVGALVRGDTLISNFNNGEPEPETGNEQGRGTTLVQISPSGHLSLFAEINAAKLPGPCPGGVGLTTALAILPGGYVVVGSLPTADGQAATAQAGCLIVLDPWGHVIKTIPGGPSGPINGPWDATAVSAGPFTALFVTNVLNGTVAGGAKVTNGGTVVRLGLFSTYGHAPTVFSEQVIGSGFPERTDPEALVVGPTGVGLGNWGTLYVADTQGNRIAAIPDALFRQTSAGTGFTVTRNGFLNNPLGLTIAPGGDIVTANAGDGNLVETTPFGTQSAKFDTGAGGGGLFGLVPAPFGHGILFVNDTENAVDLAH